MGKRRYWRNRNIVGRNRRIWDGTYGYQSYIISKYKNKWVVGTQKKWNTEKQKFLSVIVSDSFKTIEDACNYIDNKTSKPKLRLVK